MAPSAVTGPFLERWDLRWCLGGGQGYSSQMPKTPPTWPAGAFPRLLSREEAARYCGRSVNTFMDRVKEGVYPEGKSDNDNVDKGGRLLWDRHQLDIAIDRRFGNVSQSSQVDLDRAELDAMYGNGAG